MWTVWMTQMYSEKLGDHEHTWWEVQGSRVNKSFLYTSLIRTNSSVRPEKLFKTAVVQINPVTSTILSLFKKNIWDFDVIKSLPPPFNLEALALNFTKALQPCANSSKLFGFRAFQGNWLRVKHTPNAASVRPHFSHCEVSRLGVLYLVVCWDHEADSTWEFSPKQNKITRSPAISR